MRALEARGRGRLPPLVLLHGLSSSGADHFPLFPHLRGRFRQILAPDLPGHGASAVPPGGMGVGAVRDAAWAGLDALVQEPSVLFGNSLGGLVALRWALAHPDRVSALVLASPAGAPMPPADLEAFLGSFRMRSFDEARAFVARVLARPDDPRVPVLAWGTKRRFDRAPIREILRRASTEALLDPAELRELRVPALILWGRQERILPAACREFFRNHLPPGAIFEEPEGYGHAPFLDDPRGLAARVAAFAEGAIARGGAGGAGMIGSREETQRGK